MTAEVRLPPAQAVRLVRSEKCGNCKFAAAQGRGLSCHRYPPTAAFMPGQGGQPITISNWPPVQVDQFCGEWKPKIAPGVN